MKPAWKRRNLSAPMATTPSFTTVVPLANRVCRLLQYAPIFFDEKMLIRSMRSEHIGAVIQRKKSLAGSLSSKTKCLIIPSGKTEIHKSDLDEINLCVLFALNAYAKRGAAVSEFAFVFKEVKISRLLKVIETSGARDSSYSHYEIEHTASPESIKALYQGARMAISKDRVLNLSIRRYNAALTRAENEDKIVDITICLESIFNAQTELAFRFGIYNSILAEDDPEKRPEVFALLKDLYKERSNIVHGNKSANHQWINANWNKVIQIAKLCLIKKIEFLQTEPLNDWQAYLDRRTLGASVG